MKKPPFNQLLSQSEVPVLVDFYADWCGPCQTLSPVVQSVAKDFGANLKVIKINVDKNKALAQKFGIRSIPTLVLFQKGKISWKKAGLFSKRELITRINNSIN